MMKKKEEPLMAKKHPQDFPVYWFETSDSVSHRFQFESDGHLSVKSLSLSLLRQSTIQFHNLLLFFPVPFLMLL